MDRCGAPGETLYYAGMALPDDARCRIILCDPPLADDALAAALGKLFAQFVREQRCTAWSCSVEHDGSALVLAWTPDIALSGCSHDKIHGVLAAHHRDPVPPPFAIRMNEAWRCVDRGELRRRANADTPLLDQRIESLGDWRARGLTTVGAAWAQYLPPTAIPA